MRGTEIQTFNRTDRHIFWRKVYTFSAICFLSGFVIFWTHFGNHFGINDDLIVDVIDFNRLHFRTNFTRNDQDCINDSFSAVNDERSKDKEPDQFNDINEVKSDSNQDQITIEELPKLTFENAWNSINENLANLQNDKNEIKTNILNIEKYQENNQVQMENVNEKLHLIDEAILDIGDEILSIKNLLQQVLINQKRILVQSSSADPNKKVARRKQ